MHPHRGIETISLVVRGSMIHKDSLGNEDRIESGEVQWMTAGSGILHEERLPASERLLGVQLWLNMPAKDKMAPPAYHSIHREEIPEIPIDGGNLRLIAGTYQGHTGHQGLYQALNYYDIALKAGSSFNIETAPEQSVMVFLLQGSALVAGEPVEEKTAVLLGPGDLVELEASETDAEILFLASYRLNEAVSWGGPIVMNTKEELNQAFRDLENGTFIKKNISY